MFVFRLLNKFTFLSKICQTLSFHVKHLHSVIHTVSHNDPSTLVYTHVMRVYELSPGKPLGSKLPHRLPAHVEQLHSVIVLLRHYHQFPGGALHATRMIHKARPLNSKATKHSNEATVFVENLYAVVVEVCNHYVPVSGSGYSLGVPKLAFLCPLGAKLEDKCSLKVKDLHSMVVTICDDYMMVFVIDSYTPRHVKFAWGEKKLDIEFKITRKYLFSLSFYLKANIAFDGFIASFLLVNHN